MKIKLWFLLSAILYLFGKGGTVEISTQSEGKDTYLKLYKRKYLYKIG